MTTDVGRVGVADQALVQAPSPTVSALSGFDPSRCAFLSRCVDTKKAMSVGYTHSTEYFDDLVDVWTPYGRTCEFTVVPAEFVETGKDWFQRTIDKADSLPWVRKEGLLAIATEAGTAETLKDGSVHEGAGRDSGIAQTPPGSDQ